MEGEKRGAALRQMAGEVSRLLCRGCQFEFRSTNETTRARTTRGMPNNPGSYCTLHPEVLAKKKTQPVAVSELCIGHMLRRGY